MPEPAELRRRVLAAWTDSPARFREDANAEEDLVRGGYRDRLLVELAQNAADAAARAGVPGHLRLELSGDVLSGYVLSAANTGAPLDGDGVQALASLRASAKRGGEGSVGRFGVGFSAVLAVSDAPAVLSIDRSVRFSADETRAAVAGVPALADELARRDGAVPVLRLPFDVDGRPPAGFATEVVLPLRPGAHEQVRAALAGLDAELLLALPALSRIDIALDGAVRTLAAAATATGVALTDGDRTTTWRVARRTGELPAELFADRPIEERDRRGYTVTWAVPLESELPSPLTGRQVVHAPTPSDEPLSLPARLIAPFPLGPDRRHVAPGPVTDALVEVAADGYAQLLAELPAEPVLLQLVPRTGLAAAELDAVLCSAVLDRLRAVPWLPPADPEELPLRPDRAVALDDPTEDRVAALIGVIPGLLPAGWSRGADGAVLRALGARRAGLADIVEAVRSVQRPGDWWACLYASLDNADRDELAALPVPLADGRMAQTPAGVLLADESLPAARLSPLGLRIADPAAVTGSAYRVLERLGARPATAAAVLADPDVRAVVESSLDRADDGEDAEALAEAVLALVAAAGTEPGELPWLAELALPDDDDGGWAAAGELVRPGSPLADVLTPGALGGLDPEFAARQDVAALRAVGVLDTFSLITAADPDDLDVDRVEEWVDAVLDRLPADAPPPVWPALTAVRDLELVRDWSTALPLLAALPAAARADVDLGGTAVPGYLRWWLRTSPVLHGARPDRLRHPGSVELQGLYEAVDDLDENVLALLQPPATIAEVLADVEDAIDLLDRLGSPARTVSPAVLRTVYARLATALDGVDVEPPEQVRTAPDQVSADAVVLDAPWLQPLVEAPVVPAGGLPGPVADLLDLSLASELEGRARVTSRAARTVPWSAVPGAGLAAARLGLPELTGSVAVHPSLTVTGGRTVSWWPGDPDAVDGTPAALGRALAWRAGAWPLRQALSEAFAHPQRAAELAAEDAV